MGTMVERKKDGSKEIVPREEDENPELVSARITIPQSALLQKEKDEVLGELETEEEEVAGTTSQGHEIIKKKKGKLKLVLESYTIMAQAEQPEKNNKKKKLPKGEN
jgi:hypothetical protein